MTATSILESPAIDEWQVGVGDVVEVVGLTEAPEWNHKKGDVIRLLPEKERAVVGFNVNGKKSKKRVKYENLIAYCPYGEDDPRVAFLIQDASDPEILNRHEVHIEQGQGKKCHDCHQDLNQQYHVHYIMDDKEVVYCEEHFVANCTPEEQRPTFVRWCTVCHDYIPIRDGVPLPTTMLDSGTILGDLYPDSQLPDGRSLIFDNSFHEDEPYWAHRNCFGSHYCSKPFWDHAMTPHGFKVVRRPINNDNKINKEEEESGNKNNTTNKRQPVVNFFCAPSKKDALDGCEHKHAARQVALKKLQDYRDKSVEELRAILLERKIESYEDDSKEQLLRKLVVTDETSIFSPSGQYYAHKPSVASVIPRSSILIPSPSASAATLYAGDLFLQLGPQAPGFGLVTPNCYHGTHMVHNDTSDQRHKRNLVAEFFLTHRQELENGRVMYTSFYTACSATILFWADAKRSELLLSDVPTQFIPKLYWAGAVDGAVRVHGGIDYIRLAVAAALITQAMLSRLEAQGKGGKQHSLQRKPLVRQNSLSASLSSIMYDDITQDFDGLLDEPALATQLETIRADAFSLFDFMDNHATALKACDCMKYIATAASFGNSVQLTKSTKRSEEEQK